MDWKTLYIWFIYVVTWNATLSAPPAGSAKERILQLSKKATPLSSLSSSSPSRKTKKGQKCCENGGLCVLGVFCHCPEKFYGYRCEHAMKPCGPVEHGQWVRVSCHLCRCFDAHLSCFYQMYSGCGDEKPEKEIDINDYLDDLKIFPPDETSTHPSDVYYDTYYEGNEYDNGDNNENKSNNSALTLSCPAAFTYVLLLTTSFVLSGHIS